MQGVCAPRPSGGREGEDALALPESGDGRSVGPEFRRVRAVRSTWARVGDNLAVVGLILLAGLLRLVVEMRAACRDIELPSPSLAKWGGQDEPGSIV